MNVPALSEAETTTITPALSERKWSFVAAALLALIYLVTSILIARHRLFWYDELYTIAFSRFPGLAAIWQALAHGGDSMPPTYYMLVRLFERLPLTFEVSARLPSALAMVIGMFFTFDCAKRLSDGLHGLIAFSVLSCSVLPYYGYEARPYALYFMFASLALWLWFRGERTKVSTVLFGIAIFLAVTVHYYAVLCLVPYVVWELWNWHTVRPPSSKLIAGFLAVVCAGVLFWKQILSLHRLFSPDFWSPATLPSLAATYDDFFPDVLFPLIAIMIVVALTTARQKNAMATAMGPQEQLCWLFALIPLAGFLLAKLGTNAFYNRYFICLLPGVAVAFSCLLWRQFKGSQWMSIASVLLFAALGLGRQFELVRHPSRSHPLARPTEPERMNAALSLEKRVPAGQLIVIPAGDVLSLELHYYAKHPNRCIFLAAPISGGARPPDLILSRENSPIGFWTLDELKTHAREVTLINPSQATLDVLSGDGYKPRLQQTGEIQVVTLD